jgi:hypothetical protein
LEQKNFPESLARHFFALGKRFFRPPGPSDVFFAPESGFFRIFLGFPLFFGISGGFRDPFSAAMPAPQPRKRPFSDRPAGDRFAKTGVKRLISR